MAHPDDETFGFGGTLAKYASEGVEIHVLCATRGEEGKGGNIDLGRQREKELRNASKILGVKSVEFMDFIDGRLCNIDYQPMARKIKAKVDSFHPDVVVTFDKLGVSGHIDHIAVSLITTFVMRDYKDKIPLYYFAELKKLQSDMSHYFIYFPPGYEMEEMDAVIDVENVYHLQVQAMHAHLSQMHDVERIVKRRADKPKKEYFINAFKEKKSSQLKIDLFK